MRRTVAAALVALALCGCTCTLAGCGVRDAEGAGWQVRFKVVQAMTDGLGTTRIYTDTKTGCQYLEVGGSGLTLLVDKYGYPLLADGYSRVEVGMSDDKGE